MGTEYRTARRFRKPSPLFRWCQARGCFSGPGRVLVFGAGLLLEAEILAELGWKVDALETSDSIARRADVFEAFSHRKGCRVISATAAARPKYQLILVTHVLEFIENPRQRQQILGDLASRLGQKGVLLLSLRGWSDVKAAKNPRRKGDGIVTGLGTWTRGFTTTEARDLVENAGLEVADGPMGEGSRTPRQVRFVCKKKA